MDHVLTNVKLKNWFIYFIFVICVSSQNGNIKICQDQKTCGKCIVANPLCEWCFQEFDNDVPEFDRCNNKAQLLKQGCKDEFISKHEIMFNITEDKELGNVGNNFDDSIQLKPQKVYLKLRPNEPYTFKGEFQLADNYPVDLYYLMDLSFTMGNDKATLAKLGEKIAAEMSKITKNFRLGFGSFVDKLILPFTLHNNDTLVQECKRLSYDCVPPYSFKNHLPLNMDSSQFSQKVSEAKISGNLDGPEGGFDAIMQAIVCENEIGWRNKSRRILIYSSDATFHFAGDGKLAGIVKPHDGLCHLDKNGVYSFGNKQDYPSVSFINYMLSQKKVVVIFAVSDELNSYERLVKKLEGAVAVKLLDDSSNVVDVIKTTYKAISSTLSLLTSGTPKGVEVNIVADCSRTSGKDDSTCSSISIGQKISFSVKVTITDKDFQPVNFTIYPVGLNDHLDVFLDVINKCDCEKKAVLDSKYCSMGGGRAECGICFCNPGRLGSKCECEYNKNDEIGTKPCTYGNSSQVCSNKGQCKCGRCLCDKRENPNEIISGKYCECENFSCLKRKEMICSGNGNCDCNKCVCDSKWTGDYCETSTDRTPCLNITTQEECSGNGVCECYLQTCRCNCNKDCPSGKRYFGELCDQCETEKEKECNRILNLCATCSMKSLQENKTDDCNKECFDYDIEDVDKIEDQSEMIKQDRLCKINKDSCDYIFVLNATEIVNQKKKILRHKVCNPPPNALAIGLGVSFGILLLGILLLLLWKLVTFIYDRKEYAKFEQERRNAKFDKGENPLYQRAVTSFKNPAYAN